MRGLLLRLWALPWPGWARRRAGMVAMLGPVQRVLVPHFRIGVVGLIQNERGEYLLFRHTYRSEHPWGLPTGFLEHGEQPADALKREIREESSLRVELSPVWNVYADCRHIVNIVFRGTCLEGHFTPSAEISEYAFRGLRGLPDISEEQRALIEACAKEERNQERV